MNTDPWDPRTVLRQLPARLVDAAIDARIALEDRRRLSRINLDEGLAEAFKAAGGLGRTRADSFENVINGMGGANDPGSAWTVRPRALLSYGECDELYEHGGYPARICDLPANDATRKGWKVVDTSCTDADDTDDDPADVVDLLAEEEARLSIRQTFRDAVAFARKDGGALIWIVVDEDVPARVRRARDVLASPLDLSRVREVRNLVLLDPMEASAYSWETDPGMPGFRSPSSWMLTPGGAGGLGGVVVHSSRLIYIPGFRLPPRRRWQLRGWDLSWIDVAYQALQGKGAIDRAGVNLATRFAWNVVRMNRLGDIEAAKKTAALDARIRKLVQSVNALGSIVLGEGEEFTSQTTNVAGWNNLDDAAQSTLCAVTGMSRALLFGDAPSGLNTDGESGKANWRDVIASFQSNTLGPELTRLSRVLFAARNGPARGKPPAEWAVVFNPLDELTETQRADLAYKRAQTRQILVTIGDSLPELDAGGGSDYRDADEQRAAMEADDAMGGRGMGGTTDAPDKAATPTGSPEDVTVEEPGKPAGAGTPAAVAAAGTPVANTGMNAAQIEQLFAVPALVSTGALSSRQALIGLRLAFPTADADLLRQFAEPTPEEIAAARRAAEADAAASAPPPPAGGKVQAEPAEDDPADAAEDTAEGDGENDPGEADPAESGD